MTATRPRLLALLHPGSEADAPDEDAKGHQADQQNRADNQEPTKIASVVVALGRFLSAGCQDHEACHLTSKTCKDGLHKARIWHWVTARGLCSDVLEVGTGFLGGITPFLSNGGGGA